MSVKFNGNFEFNRIYCKYEVNENSSLQAAK